jgi:hypothetical protein
MSQVLQLAHFVEQHSVAQMQIGRSGVKTRLYSKWTTQFELFDEFGFKQQFVAAALDLIEYFLLTHVEKPLVLVSAGALAGFEASLLSVKVRAIIQ